MSAVAVPQRDGRPEETRSGLTSPRPRSVDMLSRRRFLAAAGAMGLARAGAAHAAGAVARFTSQQAGALRLSHQTFESLLGRYVRPFPDGINRVDYAGWSRSAADRHALNAYLEQLSAVAPESLTRAEQFAFWANLYNAVTLRVVLEAYPVASIRAIRRHWLAIGPWDSPTIHVAGLELSLNDVEHGILRRAWQEPRVHYAVNCASLGCPNLPRRAWHGDTLEADLSAAARAYVNHPRGAQIVGERLIVSSIYRWYRADFGGSEAGVIGHLRSNAAPQLQARLANITQIANDEYNWTLNDAPRT